jgi:hypothetical protein
MAGRPEGGAKECRLRLFCSHDPLHSSDPQGAGQRLWRVGVLRQCEALLSLPLRERKRFQHLGEPVLSQSKDRLREPSARNRKRGSSGVNLASCRIVPHAPSIWRSTSSFQKRNVRNPWASKWRSRMASRADSECWPPSTSMISFASKQTKSRMLPSSGTCRLNFSPSSCLLRSACQSTFSALVASARMARAKVRCRSDTRWRIADEYPFLLEPPLLRFLPLGSRRRATPGSPRC